MANITNNNNNKLTYTERVSTSELSEFAPRPSEKQFFRFRNLKSSKSNAEIKA